VVLAHHLATAWIPMDRDLLITESSAAILIQRILKRMAAVNQMNRRDLGSSAIFSCLIHLFHWIIPVMVQGESAWDYSWWIAEVVLMIIVKNKGGACRGLRVEILLAWSRRKGPLKVIASIRGYLLIRLTKLSPVTIVQGSLSTGDRPRSH
jgi:hypothetical protein